MNITSFFTANNIYLSFIWCTLFCLLISPFITPSNLFDPFQNGPILWIYLITNVTILFVAIFLFRKRSLANNIGLGINIVDFLILATLVYILIRQWQLRGLVYFTDKLLVYLCAVSIYLILKAYISNLCVSQIKRFTVGLISLILLITFLSSLIGILQLYRLLPSPCPVFLVTGNFYNPARYANYLIALLPFCISTYFFYPVTFPSFKPIRVFSTITSLTTIMVLPLTNSRAAWIGICVATCIILYFKYQGITIRLVRNAWIISLLIIVIITLACLLFKLKPVSALGRITIWKISLKIIGKNPIEGIGYGRFEDRFDKYQADYFSEVGYNNNEAQNADIVRYPYNIFLQILCEQGLIGIILFVSLLYHVISLSISLLKQISNQLFFLVLGALSSIIAVIICGQASYPFDIMPVLIIFFINIGLLSGIKTNSSLKLNNFPDHFKIHPRKSSLILLGTILVCSVIILNYFEMKKYLAYRNLGDVNYNNLSSEDLGVISQVVENDVDYIDMYTERLYKEKKYKETITILKKSDYILIYPHLYTRLAQANAAIGNYKEADINFKIAADMVPCLFLTKYLWIKFYYDHKELSKASDLSKKTLEMKIKVPSDEVIIIRRNIKNILLEAEQKKKFR